MGLFIPMRRLFLFAFTPPLCSAIIRITGMAETYEFLLVDLKYVFFVCVDYGSAARVFDYTPEPAAVIRVNVSMHHIRGTEAVKQLVEAIHRLKTP